MSEFKFACPVCGQHITADSTNAGTQIDCPTCFQSLIIPQAPAAGSPNLILSAATATRKRTAAPNLQSGKISKWKRLGALLPTLLTFLILLAAGMAIYIFRHLLWAWLHRLGL